MTCKTANDIWKRINTQQLLVTAASVGVIRARLHSYKYQTGHDVTTHISAIETLAEQLRDAGGSVEEADVLTKIVTTLPLPKFRSFRSTWVTKKIADETIVTLTEHLIAEEEINKEAAQESDQPSSSALRVETSTSGKRKRESTSRTRQKNKVTCTFCKRSGHMESDCWDLQEERGERERRPTCTNCKRLGHVSKDCWRRRDEARPARVSRSPYRSEGNNRSSSRTERSSKSSSRRPESPAPHSKKVKRERESRPRDYGYVTSIQSRSDREWNADSGATNHMTDKIHLFTNFKAVESDNWTVDGIGGMKLRVAGRGDIPITVRVKGRIHRSILNDVLFVPGLNVNLFSIKCVTNRGYDVTFSKNQVIIKRGTEVKMTGSHGNGSKLYQLNFEADNHSSAQAAVASDSTINIWHQRLSHVNCKTILRMDANHLVHGMTLKGVKELPSTICSGCAYGKMTRLPFPVSNRNTSRIGELIHTDVEGPIQVPSTSGSLFYVLFIDDYSGMRIVYFMKNKSEVFKNLKSLLCKMISETGKTIRTLRSDGGGEFMSEEMKVWMTEKGIRHETSIAYTPQQNGVSERGHRTICDAARSILHMKNLPLSLWAEAVSCSVYTRNRTPSQYASKTPYEMWNGKKPDLSHLRIFGSEAFVHVPDAKRRKLDAKSIRCFLIGYCDTQKGYRFWDPSNQVVRVSRDAIINENPDQISSTEQEIIKPTVCNRCNIIELNDINPTTNPADEGDNVHPVRRSSRPPQPTKQWEEWATKADATSTIIEPNNYSEALSSKEAPQWKKAMQDEYDALIENGTWYLVDPPSDCNIISSRWTYKVKRDEKGDVDRFRCRVVGRGFSQIYGLDYTETYSPVVKHDSLRVILSIAAAKDLEIVQVDVKGAFLQADITEELYMEQPEGFVRKGSESKVCRLKKALYGLKQSSRLWNKKLDGILTNIGFIKSTADSCVYIRQSADEFTLLGLWVDDGILCSNSNIIIEDVTTHLRSHFQISSKPANYFVGLHIIRDRKNHSIFLSQQQYVKDMLHRFNMASCHPRIAPADTHSRPTLSMSPKDILEKKKMESVPYRELIGSLSYAANCTRPDISYAVNRLAQFCSNPGKGHWEAAKRVLAYLAGTSGHGLLFSSGSSFIGYTDSDFGGDTDCRKSTTGFIFLLFGGAIAWGSKRQSCTTLSTTEAEYVAACETTKEAVWLRYLLDQIGVLPDGPSAILCDNQSAIRLVHNPEHHQRTKHIAIRYHFIREKQEAGDINVRYINTKDQLADIFTKPLESSRFRSIRERIGVVENPAR